MKNFDKKRICVVGAGNWGQNHIKTLHSLDCLYGVVDNNEILLEKVKKNYSNCSIFINVDDAIMTGFDGYIIATNASSHFSIAKKLIKSKNHILIEKPMTLNTKDSKELCQLAHENKVNLMVGHLLLFHPAFNKIKSMLDEGFIGKLQYMYSNRLNFGTIRSDENVFWSFAPHDISLFQYYSSSHPEEIVSIGADILQPGIHDSTITTLKYKNGVMGHIFVSWLHPFKEHRFVLIGSKGMLYFEDSKKDKPLLYFSKSISFDGNVPITEEKDSIKVNYNFEYPLTAELKYFINGINGSKLKIANGFSGHDVIDILERASKSLKGEKSE
jgi:UDP-2-acetamido-3-amino-2,3-dideoxy-glucuronate N-acetyltransferase